MGLVHAIKSLDSCSVRVDPKDHFDIGDIMGMLAGEKLARLILPSVLQQHSIWNTILRSRLIESILLRIPLSTFYFDADVSGTWRVVDGVQRLFAIRDYINGVYPLECLEYCREESNGKLFSELKSWQQRRITHTHISIQEICCTCPREVKLNIFERVRRPEHLDCQAVYRRQKYLGLVESRSDYI